MKDTLTLALRRIILFKLKRQTSRMRNLPLQAVPSEGRNRSLPRYSGRLRHKNLWTPAVAVALLVALCPKPSHAATAFFSGLVKGGLTPISGATVTFYAAGRAGYGSSPTLLAQTASDPSGAFSLSGYRCPVGDPETYVLTTGGDAGNGSNPAIGLMAVTGKCKGLRSTSFVTVNELTTVAAQWPLAQFIDATGINIGTSPGNARGLANAVAGALTDLVRSVGTDSSDSGVPAKFLPAGSRCSTSGPANCDGLERLNALANILAACDLSSGPSSPACNALFKDTGTPQDGTTLEAAHRTLRHPKHNVKAIWSVQRMLSSLPYQPALSSPPDGWELALLFAPAGAEFNVPVWVALDVPGNVWVVNGFGNSVSELPAGNYNKGATNFHPAAATFSAPFAVALDTAGNVFVANAASNSVGELPAGNFNDGATSLAPPGAAFSLPSALALDASDNLWVANLGSRSGVPCDATAKKPCGSVSELLAGNYSTDGANFAPAAAQFDSLETIALDPAGDAWTANLTANSVSELEASNHRQGVNFAPASAGLDAPVALALDNSNNTWVANQTGGSGCSASPQAPPCGSVSELPAGNVQGAVNFTPPGAAIVEPNQVALDSAGNVWVSNFRGGSGCDNATPCGSVSELPAGNFNNGAMNFAPVGAAFDHPTLLALDSSGNVWVTHFAGVSELIGAAAPVLTPIQACLKKGRNVCRP